MRQLTHQIGSTARVAALVCALVLALAVLPGTAVAGESDTGDVVVGPNETVTGDVTAATGDVVVHGTVNGEVSAMAGSVRVTGTVTDDVSAAAGSATVDGTVDGDVSAAAGSVDVKPGSRVGGDVSAAAGSATVDRTVEGDVSAGGGSVTVSPAARVEGNVGAGGGDAVVEGTVEGDVESGETVVLASTAEVRGDVTYDESLDRADGATIDGTVTQADTENLDGIGHVVEFDGDAGPTVSLVPDVVPDAWSGVYWAAFALVVGAFALVVGAFALLLFPEYTSDVATRAGDGPLRSTAAGFTSLVAVPAVLVAFVLTVVGIPVALAGGALFGLAAWVGFVYGQYLLGRQLLAGIDVHHRWAALAVGIIAVAVLSAVPLFGDMLRLAVLVVGLGAVALAAADRWRDESEDQSGPTGAEQAAGTA